jgi:uncharacterized protein YjbJ (UPF0337 family)
MDRDRVDGLASIRLGRMGTLAVSILGDSKLEAEGRMSELEGRIQNTIGGAKDALRETNRRQ